MLLFGLPSFHNHPPCSGSAVDKKLQIRSVPDDRPHNTTKGNKHKHCQASYKELAQSKSQCYNHQLIHNRSNPDAFTTNKLDLRLQSHQMDIGRFDETKMANDHNFFSKEFHAINTYLNISLISSKTLLKSVNQANYTYIYTMYTIEKIDLVQYRVHCKWSIMSRVEASGIGRLTLGDSTERWFCVELSSDFLWFFCIIIYLKKLWI